MLITAATRMSARSNAFRFFDPEPALDDVNVRRSPDGMPSDARTPSYYIRGAITQLDASALDKSRSADSPLPKPDPAVSRNQVISIDLNVGQSATPEALPGLSASNSITLIPTGVDGDASGVINKAGVSFNVALDKNGGSQQAVRSLVELSAMEVLGKLAHVAYWQCLGIDSSNPTFQGQAREWFDGMTPGQKITYVQAGLRAGGYYQGPAADDLDDTARAALARWQTDNGLPANGQVEFDVYYRMLNMAGQDGAPSPVHAETDLAKPSPAAPALPPV